MVYRDRAFCISPHCHCWRKLTEEVKQAAREWWKSKDNPTGEGAPISMGYFCGPPEEAGKNE